MRTGPPAAAEPLSEYAHNLLRTTPPTARKREGYSARHLDLVQVLEKGRSAALQSRTSRAWLSTAPAH